MIPFAILLVVFYYWYWKRYFYEPPKYHEYQMDELSSLRPKKCPNCGGKQENFFVGTDGLTCMRCTYNIRPKLKSYKPEERL